jgi:hypothetical protein
MTGATMTEKPPIKAVELDAELRQVKSMTDHSYNVILNVGEEGLKQVQQLMGWIGDMVKIVMVDETK